MGGAAVIAMLAVLFGFARLCTYMCGLAPEKNRPPALGFWRGALLILILVLAEIGVARVFQWLSLWLMK